MGSTIHSNRRNKTKRVCLCWRLIIFTRCIITVNTILQAVLVFITWFISLWYFDMWESKKGFLPDVDFSDCPWTIESFPKFDGPLIFFFVKIVYSYKSSKLQTAKEYKKKQVAKLFFSIVAMCFRFKSLLNTTYQRLCLSNYLQLVLFVLIDFHC